jgi:hypothetical protein
MMEIEIRIKESKKENTDEDKWEQKPMDVHMEDIPE